MKPIDESQLRCAFELLDSNHDGKVTQDEMKTMLNKLGIAVADETVKQLLSGASKSGNNFFYSTDIRFLSCA